MYMLSWQYCWKLIKCFLAAKAHLESAFCMSLHGEVSSLTLLKKAVCNGTCETVIFIEKCKLFIQELEAKSHSNRKALT